MAEPTSFKVPPGGKVGKGISKKVLGMPLWAWIGISTVAILIALYLRSQQPADDATSGDEYTDDYADPTGTYYETPLQDTPDDTDVSDNAEDTDGTKDVEVNIDVESGDGGPKKNPCGKRPKTPAGIGQHWKCNNGKWVRAKNNAKQNKTQKAVIEANKKKNSKQNNKKQNNKPKTVRKSASHVTVGGNTPSPVPQRTAKQATKKPTAVQAVKAKPKSTLAVGAINTGNKPKLSTGKIVSKPATKPVSKPKKKK